MRLARRILITIVCTFACLALTARFALPIALSFYAVKKAPSIARTLPANLADSSVSPATGLSISTVGYRFEAPWSDLDESKTELYPRDGAKKTSAILHFKSGLALIVKDVQLREYAKLFAEEFHMSPAKMEAVYGSGTATSDYTFESTVFNFTPDKMHHWSMSQAVHSRETAMLIAKSIMPVKGADTGIFRISNNHFKGFQQGDPSRTRDPIDLTLHSEDHQCEIIIVQKTYTGSNITQPEINRIVQTFQTISD